jgi:hypothetical protein
MTVQDVHVSYSWWFAPYFQFIVVFDRKEFVWIFFDLITDLERGRDRAGAQRKDGKTREGSIHKEQSKI